jgi:trigger factor
MKSIVKNLSEWKREIEVEVDTEEVKQEWEKILQQYAHQAKISGFRPGKAPKDMVKRMFYPKIKEAVVNSLAPKALEKELQSKNLRPIGAPVVNEIHFKEGEPLRLKAQFDIWPDIKLPEYKNIEVKKKTVSVSAKEIEKALEELRLKAAQYLPVTGRGVAEGDYVIAEVKGRDIVAKKFLPTEKVVIVAGDQGNEPVLNQCLIGLKPEDNCDFEIVHDKEHQNKKLAGRKIAYNLKVVSIKERKVPEINDDFAKDLGEYENLKALKKEIKENIRAAKEKEIRSEMALEIIKEIYQRSPFEVPETLLNQEYGAVMRRILSSRPQKEFKKEEVEELKKEGRKKAEQNIRNHLILDRITGLEGIKVSDEEVQEELKTIAKSNQLPLAKVIENFNREGRREELKETLLFRKAVDFLVDNAIIK